MGKSSGGGSQTQRVEPPKYLQPYLQGTMSDALSQYRQGGQQYYPGNTVVPFSPQTEQAMQMTEQRALNGSPLNRAASQYSEDVLSGKYLNGNPYLDATFNRAADQVQNRIQSGFAGSGRNIEAGRPLAAQEMNDLATGIYGGAYGDERRMQQALVPFAGSVAANDYADYDRLMGVGSQVEDLTGRLMEDQAARWDFEQNREGMNPDQYLARLGQYPGEQRSTPVYHNRMAGLLGGGTLGYSIGSGIGAAGGAAAGGAAGGAATGSMAGPYGALIGAGLGYLLG